MVVPSTPTPSPASVSGRHVSRAGTTNAATAATSQASAPTAMTGHTSSNAAGSIGGSRFLPGSTDIASKIARRRCRPEPRPEVGAPPACGGELGNWAGPDDDAGRNRGRRWGHLPLAGASWAIGPGLTTMPAGTAAGGGGTSLLRGRVGQLGRAG